MDSVTQAVLGAAVGEAVLGRRVGRRAALWGAVAGTVPDLDVLADPFLTKIQQLEVHRGITHSVLFTVIASPLLGWLLWRLNRRAAAGWRGWSWLAFWAIATHIALDCFTLYGTQIFQPFSDYRVIIGTVFIIDPLYTLPLLIGLSVALCFRRNSHRRHIANALGLGLSSAYLLLTLANKQYVETVFEQALEEHGQPYRRLFVYPTAFNNLLWIGLAAAADGKGTWIGRYSILDDHKQIDFDYVANNRALLQEYWRQPVVQRLLWFSEGFYTVEEKDGELYFNDMHLPRTDSWLDGISGDFVFRFRLIGDPNDSKRFVGVRQIRPPLRVTGAEWRRFLDRVLGE